MLILKLAYNEELDFVEELQELRELLKNKGIIIGLVESIENKTHIIKIICDEDTYNEKIQEVINLYVSNILYRIVIDNYRAKEMFEFLTDNYFFLKQSEILEVEDRIVKILKCEEIIKDEESIYCLNRVNSMVEKIRDCINEKQEININGFITFRMRKLRNDIEKIIDKVVENYIIEKEYNEFIQLLKYFVDIQESKIQELNIIIDNDNNYIIKDGNGKDIYKDFLNEFASSEDSGKSTIEDVLISGLITSSPKKIVIHNRKNGRNKEFLDTVEKVFQERIIYCNDYEETDKKILTKDVDIYN